MEVLALGRCMCSLSVPIICASGILLVPPRHTLASTLETWHQQASTITLMLIMRTMMLRTISWYFLSPVSTILSNLFIIFLESVESLFKTFWIISYLCHAFLSCCVASYNKVSSCTFDGRSLCLTNRHLQYHSVGPTVTQGWI